MNKPMDKRILLIALILALPFLPLWGEEAPGPAGQRYEYDYDALNLTVKEEELAFSLGNDFFAQGDIPRAIMEFSRAIELNPRFADAWYNRGIAHYQVGEKERALADFSRAIRLKDDFTEAYFNRGILYFEKGETDRAIQDFTQTSRLSPREAGPYYYRGLAYRRKKNLPLGIRDFSQAITLDPNHKRAYYSRGLSYDEQGDLVKAIEDYSQAILLDRDYLEAYYNRGIAYRKQGDFNRAIFDYTEAIRLNPQDLDVYYNRGIANHAIGFQFLAVQDFTKYLEGNPADAEAYYNRAMAHRGARNFEAALLDYDRSIAIRPNNGNYYSARGNLRYDTGNYPGAIEDYTQVIALNPRDDRAYCNRGNVYAQTGELDRALEDYSQAIRINGKNPAPYFGRGNLYDDRGEYDRAIEEYTRAIRLDPKDSESFNNRGIAYYHKRDYPQAIADYTQAIALNPENPACYANRGNAHDEMGNLDEAIADYSRALVINPQDYRVFNNRGVLYFNKGEYSKAIEDYTQALDINPFNASAYANRGNIYGELGELDKAIADYTMALTIKPDYELVYSNRGSVYYKKGEYDRALLDFEKSLASAEGSVNFNDILDVAWSLAGSIYQTIPYLDSDVDTASFHAKYISLSRLGISQGIQRTEQVRSALGSRGLEVMARRLYLYYAAVDLESHFGSPEKAFEYSESLRSRGFLEQLGTEAALRLPGVTAEEREAIQKLSAQIDLQQSVLNRYNNRRIEAEGAAEFAEAGLALTEAENQLAALDEVIETRIPRYGELRNPKPASIETAKAWCGDDRAALEYALWDESIEFSLNEEPPTINSYCLVLTKNGVIPIILDPAYNYLEAINALRRGIIRHRPEEELEELRNELYDRLIKPALPHIPSNIKNLVIAPDGALMHLPFDLLRENQDSPDFGETYRLSLSPSISVSILASSQNPGERAAEPILAFGGAWYNRNGAAAAQRPGVTRNIAINTSGIQGPLSRPQEWPDLPGTVEEVQGLQNLPFALRSPTIYLGEEASEKKVKELSAQGLLKNYPILHFACHGYFDEQVPALSGIVFSEVSGRLGDNGEDGYLTIPEIAILTLNARMAVLSACETGLGLIKRGEGMVGLTRSFLVAGAENVGVSLWSISDQSARDFMRRLYRKVIEEGASFREAYFLVRNEFREDPQWSHPIHWAGFTLYE